MTWRLTKLDLLQWAIRLLLLFALDQYWLYVSISLRYWTCFTGQTATVSIQYLFSKYYFNYFELTLYKCDCCTHNRFGFFFSISRYRSRTMQLRSNTNWHTNFTQINLPCAFIPILINLRVVLSCELHSTSSIVSDMLLSLDEKTWCLNIIFTKVRKGSM